MLSVVVAVVVVETIGYNPVCGEITAVVVDSNIGSVNVYSGLIVVDGDIDVVSVVDCEVHDDIGVAGSVVISDKPVVEIIVASVRVVLIASFALTVVPVEVCVVVLSIT